MSLLGRIAGPTDTKGLSCAALGVLAQEIRAFLSDKVSGVGGQLGPNLGVVESVHDVIENSHAATALSSADGLAKAFAPRGAADRRVVAIVGDGALTGGMCWEALNNIGVAQDRPVIIVLNNNGRSYSPTVSGLARRLAELRRPEMGRPEMGRSDTARQTVFEDLGLAYLGPVDGHDISDVESALRRADGLRRPVVVHCVTRKGKGYPPAEQDEADCMHTVGVIDPSTGRPRAAGLAIGGMHPVVAIYSTFLSRAFDQLLTDVALHRLPVTVVLDRAGITGPDIPIIGRIGQCDVLRDDPATRHGPPPGQTPARPPPPCHPGSCRTPPAIRACTPTAWTLPASPPPSSNDSPPPHTAGRSLPRRSDGTRRTGRTRTAEPASPAPPRIPPRCGRRRAPGRPRPCPLTWRRGSVAS